MKQFKLELWSLWTECKIAFTSSVLTGRPGYYRRSTVKALLCKSTYKLCKLTNRRRMGKLCGDAKVCDD